MKIFKISFMIVSLLLSTCSNAAPSTPTDAVQAPTLAVPSREASPTALLVLQPTETATQEPVAVTDTAQPSDTPLPTSTSGLIMESVGDAPQPSAQAQACGRPPNWPAYTVQRSDTLSSLAQRTGTSTQQIQTANCLAGTLIFAGQVLYLPFVPASQAGGGNPSAGTDVPSTGSTTTIRTPKVGLPGDHLVNISPTSGPPGTEFRLSVNEYASNEEVSITIISVTTNLPVLALTLYTDDDGNLSWVYRSPVDIAVGDYKVFEDGMQSRATGKGHFSITAPTAPNSP